MALSFRWNVALYDSHAITDFWTNLIKNKIVHVTVGCDVNRFYPKK